MTKAIVVLSGGMDSTAALYHAFKHTRGSVACISFDYGQRHRKELNCAKNIADLLEVPFSVVDLKSVTGLLKGSSLTDDIDVPEGHYAAETMKSTVVPNRNAMMANIAIAYAVAEKAECIVMGVHAGDHDVYPDCRPQFMQYLEGLAHVANEGFIDRSFFVGAPWMYHTKAEIVEEGELLGVPWALTWTCYNGGENHCGRCSTCVERLEAFHIAGVPDQVVYEDREFWKTVTENA